MARSNALKLGLGFLALVFLTTSVAVAHGPTRKKVRESVDIDAPPAEVWALVGDFQGWHQWLPMIESTRGEGGNGEGATRTLVMNGGAGEVNEELKRYDGESMVLSYRIPLATHDVNVFPVSNYSSTISVRANEAGGSTVTWRGAFYRGYMRNDPPEALNDEAAVAAVTALYQAGLNALKAHFEGE